MPRCRHRSPLGETPPLLFSTLILCLYTLSFLEDWDYLVSLKNKGQKGGGTFSLDDWLFWSSRSAHSMMEQTAAIIKGEKQRRKHNKKEKHRCCCSLLVVGVGGLMPRWYFQLRHWIHFATWTHHLSPPSHYLSLLQCEKWTTISDGWALI